MLYIEWSFIRQSFVQLFNPLLQLQVLGVLLTTPLFWIFLAMVIAGYYAATSIEAYLEQGAKQTKIDAEKAYFEQRARQTQVDAEKDVSRSAQTFQERQPNFASPAAPSEQTNLSVPSPAFPRPVRELKIGSLDPQVKLLEWAIQSSQKVRFTYEEHNGEKSDRVVTPLGFKVVERTLCLDGHCYLRNARKAFEIQRMRDIKIIPVVEASNRQTTSQEGRVSAIDSQTKVGPASQSLAPNVSQAKNTSTSGKQRSYIKCHIDELERIAVSEWNNTTVLSEIHDELEFRSRKKAFDLRKRIASRLTQLQDALFTWSTTISNPGLQSLSSDVFKYEEGLLRQYGYKVGMNGLSESERWEILDTVFLRPLQMDDAAYSSEWGEPRSAKRLQKLAESIAAFTRNAKRRRRGSLSKAIQDWETDLAYLKRTYYNNRFSFQYPRTS